MGAKSRRLNLRFSGEQLACLRTRARELGQPLSKTLRRCISAPASLATDHSLIASRTPGIVFDDSFLDGMLRDLSLAGRSFNLAARDMNAYARLKHVKASDNSQAFSSAADAAIRLRAVVEDATRSLGMVIDGNVTPVGFRIGKLDSQYLLILSEEDDCALASNTSATVLNASTYIRAVSLSSFELVRALNEERRCTTYLVRLVDVYRLTRETARETNNVNQIRRAADRAIEAKNLYYVKQEYLAEDLEDALGLLEDAQRAFLNKVNVLRAMAEDLLSGRGDA